MWKGKFRQLHAELKLFFFSEVMPHEQTFFDQVAENRKNGNAWQLVPIIETLRAKAKAKGYWNLFLPSISGLTLYEYGQLSEIMGHALWFTQVFNCDAPDTGNMETLHLYGTDAQKEKWLTPLLAGTMKSAFAMTEYRVASSDATNIESTAKLVGDNYVINGHKWYISGAGDPNLGIYIVMVGTGDANTPKHQRHSMILVPANTPGVKKVRPLTVFGSDDAPHGHYEITFTDVVVPKSNILLGEGRGFEIAQGRLGPGRLHHAMRSIGCAERALSMMVDRAESRVAFGSKINRHGMTIDAIAQSRMEIDQARLLVLHTAKMLDTVGNRKAYQFIAMIKVVCPVMACKVIDRAIQVHGATGVSQDTVLPLMYAGQRSLRIADGPDEVHITTVAKTEKRRQQFNAQGRSKL